MLEKTQSYTEKAGLSFDPVSLESYRSQEFYELERERIFARSWLSLCREDEIPNAGDFLVKEIEICKVSVILIRGKDGRIRAFHNVCSHRGNQLIYETSGRAPLMVCRYHSWSYTDTGNLRGVPDEASFGNFDKKSCGLTPIALDTWEGFVFINLEREPSIGLAEYLGEIGVVLKGLPYKYADSPVVLDVQFDCNWKVASDAFAESYHVTTVHKNTIGNAYSSSDNRDAHLLAADFYGPHRFCSMYANPEYVPAADAVVEKLAHSAHKTANVVTTASAEDVQDFLDHPAVNPTGSRGWAQDIYSIFPNTSIYTNPGGFFVIRYWPTSINTVRFEWRDYVPRTTNVRHRFQQELFLARVLDTLIEDIRNFKRLQSGIESGGKDFMILQDNEIMIRHQVHQIQKWARADSVAEAMQPEC